MLISYDTVYSRFYSLVTDYVFAELPDQTREALFLEWLKSVYRYPDIIDFFKEIKFDDGLEQVEYTLEYPRDEEADNGFVKEILALCMSIQWYKRQVDSVINTAQMIGGKEEKTLVNNHKYSIERLSQLQIELKKLIRDYGYLYNSYVEGYF